MIITCPHCQTRYQVAYEAIGSAGRKVQCAHCHQAWEQSPLSPVARHVDPEDDRLFDMMAEDALDEALAEEARAVEIERGTPAPITGSVATPPAPARIDPTEIRKRQAAFSRRQNAMISRLPLARLRRGSRVIGMVLLAALLVSGYFGRVAIVERYPDLAGLYEAIGLGVNVVGLDFAGLETLRATSGGNDVLMVSARIVGRSVQPMRVPPVVISLLNAEGHAVYEWSVAPQVQDLMAGESAPFETRLSLPPSDAVRVRLSFSGSRGNLTERPGASQDNRTAAAPPVNATTTGQAAFPAQPGAH